ncbi:DNA repair protein RadC [candidate division WOR-3 bacterium]|nr:DNA repair protein RadC [candidate division WOR-3 bacterium]
MKFLAFLGSPSWSQAFDFMPSRHFIPLSLRPDSSFPLDRITPPDILRGQMDEDAGRKPHAGHRARLRKRFVKNGFAGFSEHEIIELLLTLAIPRRDVKLQAKALLQKFGSLRGVLDAPMEEIVSVDGVGRVSAVALKVVKEAVALYLQQSVERRGVRKDTERLAATWRARIGSLPNEVFEVAYLDTSGCLLRDGIERLEEGVVDRAIVYPRRVAQAALKRGAKAIVLAHNHPSGDTQPSERDKDLTRALVLAGAAVDVDVLDHLIVSRDGVFSFRKAGLL